MDNVVDITKNSKPATKKDMDDMTAALDELIALLNAPR